MPTSRVLLSALLIVIVATMTPAHADDVYWGNPAGGVFSQADNWQGGVLPGTDDRAFFSIGATYTVDFTEDAETSWLLFGGGDVTFELNLSLIHI